ncbi:glycoside hydrolase family 32 protein [Nocardioides astragali]|uniref:Glycoside hydrolase family 32 protein n=1 Tax=Nocardioides astragali TaxID=1776736 RepID=A0ABW2MZ09_9ACTN|nr:glycoside hydrolase family 32 protein [Nocardioides astragali]
MSGEPMRPTFHFTPARNWMNDPNGLVWYDGEYHLFFQYNPLGSAWGNMSWGHAVSRDLTTWEELPVALEHTPTEAVFSGSVVVDRANTSGLGSDGTPAMVAVYTSHDLITGHQGQSVAWSTDKGRTWTRHPKNPVLEIGSTDFRDPKVSWYAEGGYWVMAVALSTERVVRLYRSDDLVAWTHLSDFGPAGSVEGIWECPDLFPLAVDGDPTHTRWMLVVSVQVGGPAGGSGTQYFVGDFDGTTFTADPVPGADPGGASWVDFGADYYAAVSFNDEPHGRRLVLAWMSNWDYGREVPTRPYRGAMSAARSYELRTRRDQLVLAQAPVVEGLAAQAQRNTSTEVVDGVHALPDSWRGSSAVLTVELDPGTASRCGLHVRVGDGERTVVGYDTAERTLYVDRTLSGDTGFHPDFRAVHSAPLDLDEGDRLALEIHIDTTSVEVYADGGRVVITDLVFPSPTSDRIAVFAEGGAAHLHSLTRTPVTRG